MKKKLYNLLYRWFASGTCDDCEHIKTFRDGDNRHPCNRCYWYCMYKIDSNLKEDLKDKVDEIIKVVKEN